MNKVLVALMLVGSLLTGCDENRMTTSILTGQNTDLVGRVGLDSDGTEVGAVVTYGVADTIEWGPTPSYSGLYCIFHLTQEATIEDTGDPSPLKPFLDALHARPYAGLELLANFDDDSISDVQPQWILGTAFTLTEDNNVSLNVEYSDGDVERSDVFVGMQLRF